MQHRGPFVVVGYQGLLESPFERELVRDETRTVTGARRLAWRYLWSLRCCRVEVFERDAEDLGLFFAFVREWPVIG